MGIEQAPTPCKALPRTPHPATRRSGYCEKHHDEYQIAMARYRSAVYNYKHNRTPTQPPSKGRYLSTLQFSDMETTWAIVNDSYREYLVRLLHNLNQNSLFLTALSEESIYDADPKSWEKDLSLLRETVQRVTIELSKLAQHPEPVSAP